MFGWSAPDKVAAEAIGTAQSTQQSRMVKGIVKDSQGETLIGVSVMIKGTSTGTITGLDGDFTLNAKSGDVLVFSFIGYKTVSVTVSDAPINITMQEDTQKLDEVVVVGYGTQKKVNLTGSVSSIGKKELKERVNTNVLSSIQGAVPGVTIISRPGSAPSINFRGRGNLGSSSPLFVIDGAIADAGFFGSMDPNSIESISFLKDAASSAIYGSRAAYGVVLVKTKDGDKGAVKVNYTGYVSMKQPIYKPDVLSSEWYARLSNEGALNDNPNIKQLPYSDEQIAKYRDGSDPDMYPNTNWFDLVMDDNALTTQHSVSFSGGDKVKYYTSLGYLYDDKLSPGASDVRYNLNTNITSDIKDWLTMRTSIKYIQGESDNELGGSDLMRCLNSPSTYVARQSNGEYGTYTNGKVASVTDMIRNPLRVLEKGGWSENRTKNTMIDLALDIKPIEGLVLTGQMVYKGYDYKNKKYNASMPKLIDFKTGKELNGTAITESKMELDWREDSRMLWNATANYQWSNSKHSVNALAGTSYEHYSFKKQKSYRKEFPTNDLVDLNGGSNAPGNMYTEGGMNENKMLSYFGRVNYSYLGRYLIEGNVRADASSRFHKDNRWGIFPSFSAGWRVSEEPFMKDISWINNLKVRGSWGMLGNINNVGDYDYFSTYNIGGNYNFENNVTGGIVESKPANATLGWEKVNITDIGIDFDLWGGKLGVIADYYIKKTNDILLGYNVLKEVGISNDNRPSQNIGRVNNKGLEIALTHNNRIGDISYSVGANLTKNWNKVTDLGASGPMIEGKWIKEVGYAIGTFYGYKTDGLLTQADIDNKTYITDGVKPNAGDVKYVDISGPDGKPDGKLTGADRTYLGCDVPDITYGINVRVEYKGFELSAFGQGVTGTLAAFEMEQAWAFSDNAQPRKYHLKRWTVENPNPRAEYPRIYGRTSSHSKYNNYFSDYWLFDTDYFRIKNITFGYTFKKQMIQKCGLEMLKLYLAAENMFTIRADKRMKDFDPEAPSGRGLGAWGSRSVAFGVNVTF
ncbi:MAG: TonB-dependent receptor [Bacteroides sp.]